MSDDGGPRGESERDAGDQNVACTICFEEAGHFVELPCACRAKYCIGCWETCLARSVVMRGRPQCPTCRAFFDINFDGGAVATSLSPSQEQHNNEDCIRELYNQARPAQIRLLQEYGQRVKCLEGRHGEQPPDAAAAQPVCVCGSRLRRLTSRNRTLEVMTDRMTFHGAINESERIDEMVERLLACNVFTCDLCGSSAVQSGAVWSCESGPTRVLHPIAYDICEHCFYRHTGLERWRPDASGALVSSSGRGGSKEPRKRPLIAAAVDSIRGLSQRACNSPLGARLFAGAGIPRAWEAA